MDTGVCEGTKTVLVVEDEPGIRELVSEVLKRNGYRVLTACNGDEAFSIAEGENGSIQMVLTDLVMPGVSGVELAKKLREKSPHIKILLMSGYSANTLDQHGTLDAGTSLLEKPFTPSILVSRVREMLSAES